MLNKVDMKGRMCKCNVGIYDETSIDCDWHGYLECSHCGNRTDRWVQQDLQPFPPRIKIASEGYFENGSTLGELVKTFGKDAVIQQEYDSVYIMYNREETDTEYNARVLKEQKKRIRATKQKETMEQNAKALYEQLKAKFG